MKVYISSGNSKLGKIPSISLPPIKSCRPDALCIKDCYALKISKLYPEVRRQWASNLDNYKKDRQKYFLSITNYISTNKPPYFRWHVGGDVPDEVYAANVIAIGSIFPETRFLMFTKQYDLVKGEVPKNLNIVRSMWPYIPIPKGDFPRVWIRGDLRAPADAFICEGQCTDCLKCFHTNNKTNILLKGH